MNNINLYIVNENHDILEEYNGNSIRELFLKVSKKHFHLYEMARKLIVDENKNICDESLENVLEIYFNEIGVNHVIGFTIKPKVIEVFY